MATQFEKRQAKEKEKLKELAKKKKSKKKVSKKVEEPKKELDKLALDVNRNDDGHYTMAVIRYNAETMEAKVVEVKKVTRDVGILFNQKKTALKTLTQIREDD